jgi:hypothetical protein
LLSLFLAQPIYRAVRTGVAFCSMLAA